MPKELRKLVFFEEELRTAAVEYCLRAHIPFPGGNMEELIIANDPKAMLTLRYPPDNPSDPDRVILTREQVAAALIRYCGENGIPLPRKGQKVLQVQNGELALMISVHWPRGDAK